MGDSGAILLDLRVGTILEEEVIKGFDARLANQPTIFSL